MTRLSAETLLDLWERGAMQPPAAVAVAVLSAVSGERPEVIRALPIGARDVRLMELHRELRGGAVEGWAHCPSCSEKVETSFELADLAATPPAAATFVCGTTEFRLPTTADLVAAAHYETAEEMREAVLRRCILSAEEVTADGLAAVEAAMAEADPAGDIRLALACPACGAQWEMSFDVVSFVWNEIDALARHVASEVHLLASAYGWRETDILSMSAARRQLYIRQAYG
jgi:hypothetical protein